MLVVLTRTQYVYWADTQKIHHTKFICFDSSKEIRFKDFFEGHEKDAIAKYSDESIQFQHCTFRVHPLMPSCAYACGIHANQNASEQQQHFGWMRVEGTENGERCRETEYE